MRPRLRFVAALVLLALMAGGCAWQRRDRCYLPMSRYNEARGVFEESGSMQRVEQFMEERRWTTCERNQFRYLLVQQLDLDAAWDTPAEP